VLRPFRTVFYSKPAVSLSESLQQIILNFPQFRNSVVSITQMSENVQNQKIPIGLEFRVQIDAISLHDAIETSSSLADAVASFITMVTGVGMPIPKPMICYEISATSKEHDFVQMFDDAPFSDASRKRLSPDKLLEKLTAYHKLTDGFSVSRIGRAIRWYRLGTGTIDPFEKFNAYWIGLESLNPLLQTKLGVDDDKATCSKCGYQSTPTATASGIRTFCTQQIDDGAKLYRRIRDLRIKIMHSKEDLTSLISEASTLAPLTGNVLLGAVDFLLGIGKPWTSHDELLTNATPYRLQVEGKLVAEKLDDLFPDPHLEATHSVVKVDSSPDGKTTFTVTSRFTAVIGTGARLNVTKTGMIVEGKGGEFHVQSVA